MPLDASRLATAIKDGVGAPSVTPELLGLATAIVNEVKLATVTVSGTATAVQTGAGTAPVTGTGTLS